MPKRATFKGESAEKDSPITGIWKECKVVDGMYGKFSCWLLVVGCWLLVSLIPLLSSWKDLLGKRSYRQPTIIMCCLIDFLPKRFFQNDRKMTGRDCSLIMENCFLPIFYQQPTTNFQEAKIGGLKFFPDDAGQFGKVTNIIAGQLKPDSGLPAGVGEAAFFMTAVILPAADKS